MVWEYILFKAELKDNKMTNFTPCPPHHHTEKKFDALYG